MHFGTFPLGDDSKNDPVDDLKRAIAKHHLAPDEFVALKEGDAIVFE